MPGLATLSGVALDCPDPLALARFYSELSGWPLHDRSDDTWVQLDTGREWTLAFQRVDGYRAPAWPHQDVPQQFHLDFDVADGDRQLLANGDSTAAHQPGTTLAVFADPAGHPFCLCHG